jgi:hypothetical protein
MLRRQAINYHGEPPAWARSDWQLGGLAADLPTGGSAAGESLNAVPLGAETSQQPLLTIPQHG